MTNALTYLNVRGGYDVGVFPREGDPNPDASLPELAIVAAELLEKGETVDWMPGDGTRYCLAMLRADNRNWLCFLNIGPGILRLREDATTTAADYVGSTAPQGGWRGIRPLLVALGAARPPSGEVALDRLLVSDQRAEERARADRPHQSPLWSTDADLGRRVRLLVADDLSKHALEEEQS